MTFIIKSGTTGNTAEVDADNRLQTFSSVQTASTFAAFNGNLFNINTETITLTTANVSALLYMKNIDTRNWVFTRIFYNAETSSGGSGGWLAEVVANPTGGTLISDETTTTPHNLNFGNPNELSSNAYKGAEGKTITGGTVRISTIVPQAGTRVLISFDSVILEPGSSIAVRVTPPASNTSMDIQVGFNMYRQV